MKNILPALFLAITSFIYAQDTFEKRYWDIYGYSVGMTVTSDSSILVVANDSVNNRIFYIIKTDKNGVFQWMKTDSSSRADNYFIHNNFTKFLFTPANADNFIVGSARNDTVHSQTTSLAKIDTSGNILWNKTYARPQRLNSICQTNDSGFIFTGEYPDTTVGLLHYRNWITKIDSAGNILWTKVFQNGGMEIIQTDDGGYLREGINSMTKLDENGDVIRAFEITNRNISSGSEERKAVMVNPNAYVFANYNFLTCYDSTGNLLWDRVIPLGWWLTNRSIIDIARLNDSTIVLLADELGIWPNAYIINIDVSGNMTQGVVYELNEKVTPYSLFTLNDGRFLIGCTDDYDQIGTNSFLLIKTDSTGHTGCGSIQYGIQDSLHIDTIIPLTLSYISGNNNFIQDSIVSYTSYNALEDTICYQITAAQQLSDEGIQFSIFPNPSSSSFIIKDIISTDKSFLEIFNSLGESVFAENLFGKNEYVVDKILTKGIYFVRVSDEERSIVKQLIIE